EGLEFLAQDFIGRLSVRARLATGGVRGVAGEVFVLERIIIQRRKPDHGAAIALQGNGVQPAADGLVSPGVIAMFHGEGLETATSVGESNDAGCALKVLGEINVLRIALAPLGGLAGRGAEEFGVLESVFNLELELLEEDGMGADDVGQEALLVLVQANAVVTARSAASLHGAQLQQCAKTGVVNGCAANAAFDELLP